MSMREGTGRQNEKDVMVKELEPSLSETQHLAARNLMDPNEIMKLAPDRLLLMRVGENPLIVKKCAIISIGNLLGCLMRSRLCAGHQMENPDAKLGEMPNICIQQYMLKLSSAKAMMGDVSRNGRLRANLTNPNSKEGEA